MRIFEILCRDHCFKFKTKFRKSAFQRGLLTASLTILCSERTGLIFGLPF